MRSGTRVSRRALLGILGGGAVVLAAAGLGVARLVGGSNGLTPARSGIGHIGRSYLLEHPDAVAAPAAVAFPALVPRIAEDFESARVTFVGGWMLAPTEAEASAAVYLDERG